MGKKTILVTGGAGFIGSNFVLRSVAAGWKVVNLDALTYAGNLHNLLSIKDNQQHVFVRGNITDAELVARLLREHRPSAIVHFAAESHVDRSIVTPDTFIETNVVGTFSLLRAALEYWRELQDEAKKSAFRFLHVSTDEVYGTLGANDPAFSESTAYAPNSPYAASKAGSDHLVRAYHHTYGLPTLTTNCSNNYGPFQFPEKLIPLMILNAIQCKPLPVYGDGMNVRDWLFVGDHCEAIALVLQEGRVGETYNIGGLSEKTNNEVVGMICDIVEEMRPEAIDRRELITYVKDRPGHDRRYAIDCSKLQRELGWAPRESFATGIRRTVKWYLENDDWVREVTSGDYRKWIEANYSEREARCEA